MRELRNYSHRTGITAVTAAVALITLVTCRSRTLIAMKAPNAARVRTAYGDLPLSFEENRGQTDSQVKFLARGAGYGVFLSATEAVLELATPGSVDRSGKVVSVGLQQLPRKMSLLRFRLRDADPDSLPSGVGELSGKSNYFRGKNPARWQKNIPGYAAVKFHEVYPGIDLVYRGTRGRLEYDYVVAPNANPAQIRMQIEGANALAVDRSGDLVITTVGGEVIQKAPVVYQRIDNASHRVKGDYILTARNQVGLGLGDYDRSQPLIIDPILSYGTYLGGSGTSGDAGVAITVDPSGEAIVTGTTFSADFPVQGAFQPNRFGYADAFITKMTADGSGLIYSTYAGGSLGDSPTGIAIDLAGNAYVSGITQSADFPVSVGAYQTQFQPDPITSGEGFALALDPNGGLIYSTFVGEAAAQAIAVDASGDAYLTGNVSGSGTFNVYVAKLNPTGTERTGLVPIAGMGGSGIGLDGVGNAYLLGEMNGQSPQKIFVAKTDSMLSSVKFNQQVQDVCGAGFICAELAPAGIAVEPAGNLHLAITASGTLSAPAPHPITSLILESFDSNGDALAGGFQVPFEGAGTSSFAASSIALGPLEYLFVSGTAFEQVTQSGGALTLSPGPFFLQFDPTGQVILSSTSFGGLQDTGASIALDDLGNVYMTGQTRTDMFPVTDDAFQSELKSASGNAFVVRFVATPTLTPTVSPTPTATTSPTETQNSTPTATLTATPAPTTPRTPLPTRVPSVMMTPTAVPTIMGAPTPTLTVTATTTATVTPTATPTPIGPLTVAPKVINFGRVKAGATSGVRFVRIANPARNKLIAMVIAIDFSGGSGFEIDAARSTCTAGTALARGKVCRIALTFTPPGVGAFADNLTITGNFTNSGTPVGLLGTGR